MCKVTLICSLHVTNGLCTVDELLKIIRAKDPEVIFGEVLTSDRHFYDPRSLEGQAVTRFLALKPSCKCVRVDQYDIPPHFRAIMDDVFDYVDKVSPEYQRLFEQRHHATHDKGFAYLNSTAFTSLMTRMIEIEDEAIHLSGSPDLVRGLAMWRQAIQGREKTMLANVDRYCEKNKFARGIFLVGAAHRNGVLKKIDTLSITNEGIVEWEINL